MQNNHKLEDESIKIEYNKCRNLINEADVLLFHHGKFPGMGWFIGKYTNSPYSHAGLAHWHEDRLICLEFREFHGSREWSVSDYISDGYIIDVFRACPNITIPTVIKENGIISVYNKTYNFTDNIAKNIIKTAHTLLGRSYSWWTIWQLAKTFIPFVRLRHRLEKNGKPDVQRFVCSTLVSYSYRMHFLDPVPFLSDSYTTPGDLARSDLFVKLFEII